ncbi:MULTISPECIES: hypothetical protein [Parabacteroides]|uniref:hypothetical protein n=1 Tax=Parabacteroides leei TaxID=2939491 RepID=UPI0018988A15|nr:hypothetical protein [Parabacteroides goldsteinii]
MKANDMKIVINPEYSFLTDFINDLPENFSSEGEIIYNERNVLKRYQVQGVDMIVKSFKVPILVNRIAYAFFRKSKACRSYEYALEILKRGGNTPAPIAYIEEYKNGLLNRSYYISIFDARATTIREYMDGSILDAEVMWRSFVRFTINIHRSGILHIDYSPGNILMEMNPDGSYLFSLIDINRLCFKKVSEEEALCNFDRLALSVDVSTRLAEIYAEECSLDRNETVRKVNECSDRFFLKRTIKESAKQIKREKGKRKIFLGPLQQYFFLRWTRMLFMNGHKDNCLYKKERELYLTYIKPKDERQVLNRRYRYEF